MKLSNGQVWISNTHPHESFEIYSWVSDDINCSVDWENRTIDEAISESNDRSKIYLWQRVNKDAFDNFIKSIKGKCIEELLKEGKNTFPYPFAGECRKQGIVNKIKKYNMELKS